MLYGNHRARDDTQTSFAIVSAQSTISSAKRRLVKETGQGDVLTVYVDDKSFPVQKLEDILQRSIAELLYYSLVLTLAGVSLVSSAASRTGPGEGLTW